MSACLCGKQPAGIFDRASGAPLKPYDMTMDELLHLSPFDVVRRLRWLNERAPAVTLKAVPLRDYEVIDRDGQLRWRGQIHITLACQRLAHEAAFRGVK